MIRGIPQTIQDVNVFIDGQGYLGVSKNMKLPEIAQELLERKGAVESKYATGIIKAMELTFKLAKIDQQVFKGFGSNTFKKRVPLVFRASVFSNGNSVPLVASVNGDWESISISELEGGKEMEVEVKISVQSYVLNIAGEEMIVVDSDNMVCSIGGVDHFADMRKSLQG